jgi:hypothetical protein
MNRTFHTLNSVPATELVALLNDPESRGTCRRPVLTGPTPPRSNGPPRRTISGWRTAMGRLGFVPDGELDYAGHRFLRFRLVR